MSAAQPSDDVAIDPALVGGAQPMRTYLESAESDPTRLRVMAAAIRCVSRDGLQGLSLETVAQEAGLSRSTLYRAFPGGRAEIVEATAVWEVARFWQRLATSIEHIDSMYDRFTAGLMTGAKVIARSQALSEVMAPDFVEVIAAVQPSEAVIHDVIRAYMREVLELEAARGTVIDGVDLELGADYLMRMTVSWLGSPLDADLDGEEAVRRVIRTQFLAGLIKPEFLQD